MCSSDLLTRGLPQSFFELGDGANLSCKPDFTEQEREQQEWQALGFSPLGHPLRHQREALAAQGIAPCAALQCCHDGESITLAGLSLMPHRPPVPSGEIVVFLTLEDETGLAQVTVPPDVYERSGAILLSEPLLIVQGRAARRGSGTILIAQTSMVMCIENPDSVREDVRCGAP